jgi:predicted dehydrogenase
LKKVNVGIIGCGNISGIYFENLIHKFSNVTVYACADISEKAVEEASEKWGVPIMSVAEMMTCDEIEIILNLTTPQSHYELCKSALESGKHVYVEKPLSLTFAEGLELVQLAESKELMIGGAPDTFLGAGIQTCRKLIDDGYIGQPVGATATMMCPGHEGWHPAPEFYYKKGGGPMFDMGPYYLTALVNLMGGVTGVSGMTNTSFETRTITSEPLFGTIIDVEVPTHVAGLLRFENGAVGTITTSFDVSNHSLPFIEIYGTAGTIQVPDPNTFDGPIMLSTMDGSGFKEIPLTHIYAENSRGFGVADMAQCIINGNLNSRASGYLTNHVLEIMCAIDLSNDTKRAYEMKTSYKKASPLPTGLVMGFVE